MNKLVEILVTAVVGAAIPTGAALYTLGKQASRLEQVERQVADLQKVVTTPNPAKAQCAALAREYAAKGVFADSSLKDAMNALGCARAN